WGSGGKNYDSICRKMVYRNGDKTRVYFRAFILHLKSQKDPASGGPPQLVVLPKSGNAKPIGIQYDEMCYILGQEHFLNSDKKKVEFRNEKFEFIKEKGELFSKAQKYGFVDIDPLIPD
ncbi:hypothetical protein KKA14_16975, partial [bacterium]|nr:hypothetical protein [bacterium]